jgi:formylglycine-generating enzyme required for sulfatase activity
VTILLLVTVLIALIGDGVNVRVRAAAGIQALVTADTADVRKIVEDMSAYRLWAKDGLLAIVREADVSAQRAMLLCLGEFNTAQLPIAEREPLVNKLLDIYRDHPDPGLHGAAEWLLRQWEQGDGLIELDDKMQIDESELQARKATDKRQWYVNSQGQTMAVLQADQYSMGSPESEPNRETVEVLHQKKIGRTFAIASKEVTKEQFRRFEQANPDVSTFNIEHYSRTDDSPQVVVDWYDAARYCNWLSEMEGMPKDQWCYEPNAEDEYAEGMKPAADYLQRSGYRLPTEAEWEFACRSAAVTSRYYGLNVKLLPKYAWYLAGQRHVCRMLA